MITLATMVDLSCYLLGYFDCSHVYYYFCFILTEIRCKTYAKVWAAYHHRSSFVPPDAGLGGCAASVGFVHRNGFVPVAIRPTHDALPED